LIADDTALARVPFADQIDATIDGWIVGSALERLTDAHRNVVQALYFHGLTIPETARRLGVPEGTVKSRAFYAIRALRAVFEEMGILR
jgi:RNA polymerase sigma-70 factor (ECF subfamily)